MAGNVVIAELMPLVGFDDKRNPIVAAAALPKTHVKVPDACRGVLGVLPTSGHTIY
jgi:hypothetical protein